MKKTKETNVTLLAPANSRNEVNVLHSTDITKVIYQFNPTDSHTHSYMLLQTTEIIWILHSNIS
jgi:hypothetical protein